MQRTAPKRTPDDSDKSSAAASTSFGPHHKQAKLITAATTTTQSKVIALIFDFVIGSAQPFSLVEDPDFCKLIEGISGGKTQEVQEDFNAAHQQSIPDHERINHQKTPWDSYSMHDSRYMDCPP